MAGRRGMNPVDTIWLHMDRPNNLMVIDSLLWTAGDIPLERMRHIIQYRMVAKFPVFHQVPVESRNPLGQPHWEDDPDFDVSRHLREAWLPAPGGDAEMEAFISDVMHVPFDRAHPLWEVYLVHGYRGGAGVVMRFHHALADGAALTRMLMSLTDATPDGDLHDSDRVPRGPARRSLPQRAQRSASRAVRNALHLAGELPRVVDPSRYGDLYGQVVAGTSAVTKLALGGNPPSGFDGPSSVRKRAAWSQPIPLDMVKGIGRHRRATVNDVLVSAATAALRADLVERGFDAPDLFMMVPVNMRPMDTPLPRELGNRFALVLLKLPVSARDPLKRLSLAKRRMDEIKKSPEAVLTLGTIQAIGFTRPELERLAVDFFNRKALGVLTNVAGPGTARWMGGSPLVGILGWVPGSGNQNMGICIFSYNGTVRVGFKTDREHVGDPHHLVAAFEDELDALAVSAGVPRMQRKARLSPPPPRPLAPTRSSAGAASAGAAPGKRAAASAAARARRERGAEAARG